MNPVHQYWLSFEWEKSYQPYKSKARTCECTGEYSMGGTLICRATTSLWKTSLYSRSPPQHTENISFKTKHLISTILSRIIWWASMKLFVWDKYYCQSRDMMDQYSHAAIIWPLSYWRNMLLTTGATNARYCMSSQLFSGHCLTSVTLTRKILLIISFVTIMHSPKQNIL